MFEGLRDLLISATCAVAAVVAMGSTPAIAADEALKAAVPQLAAFERLAGKTWRGEGTGGSVAGKVDIIKWELIMGGRAVQSTHSINDGEYGGRTVFFYSPNEEKLLFHYFTTADFHSTGVIDIADNGDWTVIEDIHGLPGLDEVRAKFVFHDDGWETRSQYLQNGAWVEGDGFRYREASGAEVVFRSQ